MVSLTALIYGPHHNEVTDELHFEMLVVQRG